jgi:hypothetical protein
MVTPEGCGSGLSGWQVRRLLAEEPVKSARYLAFRVYQWSPSDGKRSPGGVKMVRVPEDRDGQRIDNFLLNQLKGAPAA